MTLLLGCCNNNVITIMLSKLCFAQPLNFVFQDHAPDLYIHFQAQGFHTSMYASSWFLTLFATTFNLQVASRIMDVFMSEVNDFFDRES